MSCEGHLNRGLPHPWIDVQLSDPIGHDTPEIAQIQEEIRLMRIHLYESYTPEMKQLQEGEREVQLGERLKVFSILSQFYKERSVSFDRIITIDKYGRIQSQGGDYVSLLPEEERALRMKEYQQEMRDFTEFLRSKI